jgi:hypothetical protein
MSGKKPTWLYCLILCLLCGCAAYATSAEQPAAPNIQLHAKSVYLVVSMETAPAQGLIEGLLEEKRAGWHQLIADAITNSQLFSEIYREPGADYELRVAPRKMPQLESHYNLFSDVTLEMEAEWTLTATLTDKVVMRKMIKTRHSDGADVMNALAKNNKARAGLIRKNIQEGLRAVSLLELE